MTGGSINARPNVLCDPNENVTGTDPTGTRLAFNPNCFSRPAVGTIGNMPRNYGRLPSIFNNDLAFFKNFNWKERRGIQLRWEMYNIFNKANFRDVDGGMIFGLVQNNPTGAACNTTNVCTATFQQTNTRFGAVTSARSPRVMQGSIRISF